MSVEATTSTKAVSAIASLAWRFIMAPLRAVVVASYWGWFIAPHFASAPDLGLAGAYGLSATFGLLNMKAEDLKPDPNDSLQHRWTVRITAILVTVVLWVHGWAAFHIIGWLA